VAETEAAIDGLYARPLHEFTPARDALAALLKQNGARDEAARVKALGKPGITAWAVNQLHHHAGAKLEAFFAAILRLREVQRAGSAEDFRAAQAARKEALQALVKEAETRLKQSAHAVTPDALRRIERSLEALAAGGWPGGTAPGRLIDDLQPPGFDAFAGLSVATERPAYRPPAGKPAAAARERREALAQAEAALEQAQADLRAAKKAAAQAAAGADAARREQAEAQEQLQKAALRAREQTERAERASFEARQAATTLSEAERGVESARLQLERARRAP
jgi:DNA repair exonuclease SbcCD ATPase subunit